MDLVPALVLMANRVEDNSYTNCLSTAQSLIRWSGRLHIKNGIRRLNSWDVTVLLFNLNLLPVSAFQISLYFPIMNELGRNPESTEVKLMNNSAKIKAHVEEQHPERSPLSEIGTNGPD